MATKIRIEVDALGLKALVLEHVRRLTNDQDVELSDVSIQTKSKQNYKSEWEEADFRASVQVEK